MVSRLNALNAIAKGRGQKLSQLALSWLLSNKAVSTVIIGASRPEQIEENVKCIEKIDFSEAEKAEIEKILTDN